MPKIVCRKARRDDLPAIGALLADDPLDSTREVVSEKLEDSYGEAFESIERDSNQLFAVGVDEGEVVACMQLSFIPGLSRGGMWRGQIESVRVATGYRGSGLGRAFFAWAVEESRSWKCGLVQLNSDKVRTDSIRFYESMGFVASHEGMKMSLDADVTPSTKSGNG